jgi:magnesium chelatase subunit I
VKAELRETLIRKLRLKEVIGSAFWLRRNCDSGVAVRHSAGHHINLLGLRGQAKTRIARPLINLL